MSTFSNWKDLSSRTNRLFSAVYLGILNEDSGKGSVAGLLWHYMPAIILSLSIAIAWPLIDIAWAPKDVRQQVHLNTMTLPRLALRFVVLLVVLSFPST